MLSIFSAFIQSLKWLVFPQKIITFFFFHINRYLLVVIIPQNERSEAFSWCVWYNCPPLGLKRSGGALFGQIWGGLDYATLNR